MRHVLDKALAVAGLAIVAAALVLPLTAPDGVLLDLPWVGLGMVLTMDATARTFLLFSGILWGAALLYGRGYLRADPCRRAYDLFFVSAMAGNIGLILSADPISFYLFFALMSFSSYGLVVQDRSESARRAGRIYMVLVLVGEVLLFAGFVGIAATAETSALTFVLLVLGFGIKVGMPGLHVWLPLAHPAAPVPASAVLSGAMIKAGLLGWLRFLPLGEPGFEAWGAVLIGGGLAAAFLGVAAGLVQKSPKAILAYSSISQMGFITVGIGAGLLEPDVWPLCKVAVVVYALHHGLAKGALFLSVGLAHGGFSRRQWICAALPALALAGAPLTSGFVAKSALKVAVRDLPGSWPGVVTILLPIAAVGTGLLMIRFLLVLRKQDAARRGQPERRLMATAWCALVASSVVAIWVWQPAAGLAAGSMKASKLLPAIWPLMVAGALAWLVVRVRPRRLVAMVGSVPPGDLVVVLEKAVSGIRGLRSLAPSVPRLSMKAGRHVEHLMRLRRLESRLSWALATSMLIAIFVVLYALLSR